MLTKPHIISKANELTLKANIWHESIICGLDIGSGAIRVVIAHKGSERLSFVGVEGSLGGGAKGAIVDNEEGPPQ